MSPEALALLARQAWPGNIRELRNTLEQVARVERFAIAQALRASGGNRMLAAW